MHTEIMIIDKSIELIKNSLNTPQERFFGYLLFSQVETVENISIINKQVIEFLLICFININKFKQ